ncbi:MAG: hypothetical protein WKG00_00375 [Polyangiaceae bacterium]
MMDAKIDTGTLRAAQRALVVQVGLQLASCCAHAAGLVCLLSGLGSERLLAAPPPARAVIWVWLVAGLVWTALNARGLWLRRHWARRSTLAYWATPLAWCCCIPVPVWSIATLTRPAMRHLFDER